MNLKHVLILVLYSIKFSLQTFHESFYDEFEDEMYAGTNKQLMNEKYKMLSIILNQIILDTLSKKEQVLQEIEKKISRIPKRRKKQERYPTYYEDRGRALIPYPRVG